MIDRADMAASFDALAAAHDRERWYGSGSALDVEVERLLVEQAFRLQRGCMVALGGGSGSELRAFVDNGWECSTVDISPEMSRLAHFHFGEKVKVVCDDVYSYLGRCARATFDIALLVGELVCYAEDLPLLFDEISRTVRQGGGMVLTYASSERMRRRFGDECVEVPHGVRISERDEPPLPFFAPDTSYLISLLLARNWTIQHMGVIDVRGYVEAVHE